MNQNKFLISQATIIAGIAVVASLLGTYIYKKFKKPYIPKEWKAVGTIRKMCIFPLKSGKRIDVDEAECTTRGLMEVEKTDKSLRLRDRSFVAYHKDNHEYRNSRHHPKMVLIEFTAHDMNSIVMNAPDMKSLYFPLPNKANNEKVTIKHIKNEQIRCLDCGNEVAEWISLYVLGKESGLRMAYYDETFTRDHFQKLFKDDIEFYKTTLGNESVGLTSDLTAMHIINLPSVVDVNKRMNNSVVTVDDFRPNLVIDGPNIQPYEEDNWEWVKVGDVIMKNVMECVRCTVPTVDSKTGVRRKDREPLKTMEKYRMQSKGPSKGPVMGIHLEVFKTGAISTGDPVYVVVK